MDLQIVWFILIAILYIGYFALDGFDLGVGILLPFLAKDDLRRRVIINTIGPHWDGNEVWLITAGGATFAAFPNWYATLFSGFYFPLLLILLALIVRGVSFEFRSKDGNPRWRSFWDWSIGISSFVPALLWGVAFANFIRGVPIDQNMMYVGGFWNLLNPYGLIGGLASLTGLTLYGAVFISLKTTGDLLTSAQKVAWRLWPISIGVLFVFTISTYLFTDVLSRIGVNPGPIPIGAVLAMLGAGHFTYTRKSGWAFILILLSVILSVASIFLNLYPNVLISSLNSEWSLTIYNSSSSPYTLGVMSIVALIFIPIILAYQGWTYWVFRKRIELKSESLHY
jgi:cytochrome d ubiquinol oxidase subunit II